jgi:molecular chaperone GrpE
MMDRRFPYEDAPEESPEDRFEVKDSGDTLQRALEEEERSAIAAAEGKLRSVQKDLEELRDRHLRKLAEFDNMRKRSEREKQDYYRHALIQFARDFLPILDTFDLAMRHASPHDRKGQFGQGVGMIRRQLMDLWKKQGLTEIDTSVPFDPNVHEAVTTEAAEDVPPQTILDVLQKGYMLEDKLVRPARVKVAVSPRRTPEGGVRAGAAAGGSDDQAKE